MIELSDTSLILLWVLSILLFLVEFTGIWYKPVRAYFKKHPKMWNWLDGWLFVLVLLLAEEYMAWWWAGAIAIALSVGFSLLHDKKRKE